VADLSVSILMTLSDLEMLDNIVTFVSRISLITLLFHVHHIVITMGGQHR